MPPPAPQLAVPAVVPAIPAVPVIPAFNAAEIQMSAGTKAHFQAIGKAKRTKKPLPAPYSRSSQQSSSKSAAEPSSQFTLINCGILILQDEKFNKKLTSTIKSMHRIEMSDPNLYFKLWSELWALFSPELIKKGLIGPLPNNPLEQTCLSHGQSRLPDLSTLLSHLEHTKKKPVQVDLIYEDLSSELETGITTSVSSSQVRSTRKRAVQKDVPAKPNFNLDTVVRNRNHTIARTLPARGHASLLTQLAYLGQPLADHALSWNEEAWVIGQRLEFDNDDVTSVRGQEPSSIVYGLKSTPRAITLKVDKTNEVGRGSMRVAYAAQVKSLLKDGSEEITDYVAKHRFIDHIPSLSNHATDARMYQACGLLLREFKRVVADAESPLLTNGLKQRASDFHVSFTSLFYKDVSTN
ncbi:hypothetical protein PtB15_16B137 [Puccinia triticina]|nr:hypothetical protein PtB15_16B137 [Puccinia triticina]